MTALDPTKLVDLTFARLFSNTDNAPNGVSSKTFRVPVKPMIYFITDIIIEQAGTVTTTSVKIDGIELITTPYGAGGPANFASAQGKTVWPKPMRKDLVVTQNNTGVAATSGVYIFGFATALEEIFDMQSGLNINPSRGPAKDRNRKREILQG